MNYDFKTVESRKNTGCVKWDHLAPGCGDDAIPAWVADMDFKSPPEISIALKERSEHEIYGYTKMEKSQYGAIAHWIKNRHGYDVEREWLIQSAGVVGSLNACIDEILGEDGTVAMQTPCYPPFFTAAADGGHNKAESPLAFDGGKYVMDYGDLEQKFIAGAKVMILCNPHNPVGRAWTYEELFKLGELCAKYDVYVISDDIHCDLILPGNKYTPAMTVPTLKDRVITLISSTKTFNIAGLQTSTAIIPDEKLRKAIQKRLTRYGHFEPNIFGIEAQYAAYKNCSGWVDELTSVIDTNMDYMLGCLSKTPLKAIKPDATYLLWVDCSALGLSGAEVFDLFIKKANICPTWGKTFGNEQFIRLNLGAPRELVREMGERIVGAFTD